MADFIHDDMQFINKGEVYNIHTYNSKSLFLLRMLNNHRRGFKNNQQQIIEIEDFQQN